MPAQMTPMGWRRVPLREIVRRIENGLALNQQRDGGDLPVTRIETIAGDDINPAKVGFVSDLAEDIIARYALIPGDILLSNINSEPQIGRSVVYRGKPEILLHGMNLLRIQVDERLVSPKFLDYVFKHYRATAVFRRMASRAVGQSSINQGRLLSLEVPLPSPEAQQTIVAALDAVQTAIRSRELEQSLELDRKVALMYHLFTYGTRGEPTKQTEIGEVPVSWGVVRLGDVAKLISGGTPAKDRVEWWQGPIPWVSPKDLKRPRLHDVPDHISEEAATVGSRIAPAGTVFMVVRGMILAKDVPVSLAKVPMAFNQDLKGIVPAKDVIGDFLMNALVQRKEHLVRIIGTSAHGTRRISTSDIEDLRVPIPPLEEQQHIADVLLGCDQKFEAMEREAAVLTSLFDALLDEAMTGRLRVPITSSTATLASIEPARSEPEEAPRH